MSEVSSSKERSIPGAGAEQLAELFHAIYERLAPEFGYTTRTDTRRFDRGTENGKLMMAVCDEILTWFDRQDAAELSAQLETERLRLAGCGVAAMADTPETVAQRLTRDSPYWSASYGDVCRMVDRLMELRAALTKYLPLAESHLLMIAHREDLSISADAKDRLRELRTLKNSLRGAVETTWNRCGHRTTTGLDCLLTAEHEGPHRYYTETSGEQP